MISGNKKIIWCGCRKLWKKKWLHLKTGTIFDTSSSWVSTKKTLGKKDSANSYFISSGEDFIHGNDLDLRWLLKYYAPFTDNEVAYNKEIMYYNLPELKKFRGSKILVVGGGPSAKEMKWDPSEYDYVFSCNHFYYNEKLKNHDVALAFLGGEVDLSTENKELQDYLQNNSTIVCFEDRTETRFQKYFKFFKNRFPNRVMYAHTRYRGKTGTMPRLLCFTFSLAPREVHFIGMDGVGPNTKKGDLHNHAFQKGKRYNHAHIDYNLYTRHYVAFWDYIINDLGIHKKIILQNLGEGHPRNQTTDISRQLFPLVGI